MAKSILSLKNQILLAKCALYARRVSVWNACSVGRTMLRRKISVTYPHAVPGDPDVNDIGLKGFYDANSADANSACLAALLPPARDLRE